MIKKVFTLTGITAVTGSVLASSGGCGAETQVVYVYLDGGTVPPTDSGRADPDTGIVPSLPEASTDARVSVDASADAQPDAKVDSGSDAATDAGPGTCPTTTMIDATVFPWKPPAQLPGSCTQADLSAFVAFVEKTDDPQKWRGGDWTTNEVCRDCVFAQESTTWPPLILNAAGQLAELNVGGCIAIASGYESCGRTYQQWRSCYLEACTDCPDGDSIAFSKCVTAANKTVCKKAFDDVIPGCNDSVQVAADAETACDGMKYVFEGPFKAQCIGGIP